MMNYDKVLEIIKKFLKSKLAFIEDHNLKVLLNFAAKNNEIDFRFLLEVFKERSMKFA